MGFPDGADSRGNRRNERVHRPESLGSLRRGEPGVGRRERDDGESQEAGAPRHPPLCWWLAWGGAVPRTWAAMWHHARAIRSLCSPLLL